MLQRLQDIGGKKSMNRIYKAFENKKAFSSLFMGRKDSVLPPKLPRIFPRPLKCMIRDTAPQISLPAPEADRTERISGLHHPPVLLACGI